MIKHTTLLAGLIGALSIVSAKAVNYSFNSSDEGFTSTLNTLPFAGPWIYAATGGVSGTGAWSTEGEGPEVGHPMTTDLTSPVIAVAVAGSVTLSFDHRWSFESDPTNWDGGAVFVSVNGGSFSMLAGGSFTANGYNGAVAAGSASELAGQTAFVAASAGYAAGTFLTSAANLGTFSAGDTLQVRFRAAGDTNTSGGSPDWVVDNVNVITPVPEPGIAALMAVASIGLVRRRRNQKN